jgi:hypothetical protein
LVADRGWYVRQLAGALLEFLAQVINVHRLQEKQSRAGHNPTKSLPPTSLSLEVKRSTPNKIATCSRTLRGT